MLTIEKIETDYRAKDSELKALKKRIRLQSDSVQCQEMRLSISDIEWDDFIKDWNPSDIILTSRHNERTQVQELLFEYHKEHFPEQKVPLIYCPKDTRKQNIMMTIPGTNQKEELVLNDIVYVDKLIAEKCLDGKFLDWNLGYSMNIHSSQGLTISDPQKVWIIDDFLQWSNIAYLAVSRVEYLHQLKRVK